MFLTISLYFKIKTLCKKTLLFGVKRIQTLFLEAKISSCQEQARTLAKDEEFKLLEMQMQEEFGLEMEMENSCF
jgi:hypothetical protein